MNMEDGRYALRHAKTIVGGKNQPVASMVNPICVLRDVLLQEAAS
jgi:hypothetical protein